MADVKISELTALTTPSGGDELVVNDSGTTKKITIEDLFAGDNVKAKFGTGNDLQIYHDGSNSYIDDGGTGDLYLRGSNAVRITSADGSEKTAVFNVDGAVNIYYDNDKKLATTATGVDISGTVTADGLGLGDSDAILWGAGTNRPAIVGNKTTGDLNLYTNGSSRLSINNSGNVGIGTSNVDSMLHLTKSDVTAYSATATDGQVGVGPTIYLENPANSNTTIGGQIVFGSRSTEAQARIGATGGANPTLTFGTNDAERMRIDSSGRVLVGISGASGFASLESNDLAITGNCILARTSGNVLVGKTTTALATVGLALGGAGFVGMTRDGYEPLSLNRLTSDGAIANFYKDSTVVGSIQTDSGQFLTLGTSTTNLAFIAGGSPRIIPRHGAGVASDNLIDLGDSGSRFQDIYATNGTIQTSDRNEKQDILAITTAESNVAKACKGLLRSFRWKSAVAEKGDDARIHFGIIAQDLRDAFTAEGLDAGRYAMFISSTWWETQTEVPAVEAEDAVYEDVITVPAQEAGFREVTPAVQAEPAYYDVDGNVIKPAVEASEAVHEATEAVAEVTESRIATEAVEAKDAYTNTDTFDTLAEAPEGATERTRMGVRYPELLSFIIAAL